MRWRLLTTGLLLLIGSVAVWRIGITSAETDGSMVVDCDAAAPGVQDRCSYTVGQPFGLQVHVTESPSAGYFAFQTKLWWPEASVRYAPAPQPRDEVLWDRCSIPARTFEPDSLLFACVPFPVLSTADHTTGPVLGFSFRCEGEGFATMDLVAREGDPQLGSHFIDDGMNPFDASLSAATVVCGDPPTPTPCPPEGCPTPTAIPTREPRATPTPTPTATAEPIPSLSLTAGCEDLAFPPGSTTYVTCRAAVVNRGEAAVQGAGLRFGAPGGAFRRIFDLTVNGSAIPLDWYAHWYTDGVPIPELAPGEAVVAEGRFIVRLAQTPGSQEELVYVLHRGRLVSSVAVTLFVSSNAPRAARLELSKENISLDRYQEPAPGELFRPPPAADYELAVTNLSEAALTRVTVEDRHFPGSVFSPGLPPPAGVDEVSGVARWQIDDLADRETLRVRFTLTALEECVIASGPVIASVGGERYVMDDVDFLPIGTDACPTFTSTSDPTPLPPADPSPSPDASVDSGEAGRSSRPPSGGGEPQERTPLLPAVEAGARDGPGNEGADSAAPAVALPEAGATRSEPALRAAAFALLLAGVSLAALGGLLLAARQTRRSR